MLHRRHLGIGCILRHIGDADNDPGVLGREKPLRDKRVEHAGQGDGGEKDHQGDEAEAKCHIQGAFVKTQDAVEHGFDHPVDTAVFMGFRGEESRAHHRRERQRDQR